MQSELKTENGNLKVSCQCLSQKSVSKVSVNSLSSEFRVLSSEFRVQSSNKNRHEDFVAVFLLWAPSLELWAKLLTTHNS